MDIPQILRSKKFLAAALASVISFVGILQGLSHEQIAMVVGPLLTFVGFQGVADIGKERAKIEATRPTDPPKEA